MMPTIIEKIEPPRPVTASPTIAVDEAKNVVILGI